MILDIEKPLLELEEKIQELRNLDSQNGVDLTEEIRTLESKAEQLKEEIYSNLSAWDRVQLARHNQRPTTLDYIQNLFTDFTELHGDRYFADDPAVVAGLARFEGQTVMVIGHQKGKETKENLQRNFGMPNPEGFRKAKRMFAMAEKFNFPVITFIDTPGAYPGIEAEERGQYEAIATSIAMMTDLKTPIVTFVIGEGGSGGALGIAVGDRVHILEHSVYSVISPEGCASILWRDASKAQDAANVLGLTSDNLLNLGLIDTIIDEPLGGAHTKPEKVYEGVGAELKKNLEHLMSLDTELLLEERYQKFRTMGRVFEQE